MRKGLHKVTDQKEPKVMAGEKQEGALACSRANSQSILAKDMIGGEKMKKEGEGDEGKRKISTPATMKRASQMA